MPGFGEQMRQISLNFVPTASSFAAGCSHSGNALVINLPGQPKSIKGKRCWKGCVTWTAPGVHGSLQPFPTALTLIGGPRQDQRRGVQAFRPKTPFDRCRQRPVRGRRL